MSEPDEILTKLENAVERSTVARIGGRTMNNRKIHAEAVAAIDAHYLRIFEGLIGEDDKRENRHEVTEHGQFLGNYCDTCKFYTFDPSESPRIICICDAKNELRSELREAAKRLLNG